MQQKSLRVGDTMTTYDDYFEVVRLWRVVEIRYCAELDRTVPMVILVSEESLSDHGSMTLG